MSDESEKFSDEEARQRTEAAIRASFKLAPKTQKEMAGHSGRPPRKGSVARKDGGEPE
jgi:hypothetical protein